MPSQQMSGEVLQASLERDSVGEALGLEDSASRMPGAAVHDSLERHSVGEALGLKGAARNDNLPAVDDVVVGAGRAQPSRLQSRSRRGDGPKVGQEEDVTNILGDDVPTAGRAQPPRLQSRARGVGRGVERRVSKQRISKHDGDELHQGPSHPKRLPARNKTGPLQAASLQQPSEAETGSIGTRPLSDQQGGTSRLVRI